MDSNIYPILDKIANTNSTLEKQKILTDNKDDSLLQNIMYYAYNPHLNFYITGKHNIFFIAGAIKWQEVQMLS